MVLIGVDPPGATPLTPDDLAGLIPGHITTRAELNAWEFNNIQNAREWLRDYRPVDILSDDFARDLHRRMFGDTWRWAGAYRTHDTNIGVDWQQVPTQTRQLLDNYRHQREHGGVNLREHAVHLHRDLVWIHLFPNGNGRHARLIADLYLARYDEEPLTWGGTALNDESVLRNAYIAALRSADKGDYAPLIAFATSR
jgi:Fic-DOC domain mobile mystery protein B